MSTLQKQMNAVDLRRAGERVGAGLRSAANGVKRFASGVASEPKAAVASGAKTTVDQQAPWAWYIGGFFAVSLVWNRTVRDDEPFEWIDYAATAYLTVVAVGVLV